jgi:hypothetical protein
MIIRYLLGPHHHVYKEGFNMDDERLFVITIIAAVGFVMSMLATIVYPLAGIIGFCSTGYSVKTILEWGEIKNEDKRN